MQSLAATTLPTSLAPSLSVVPMRATAVARGPA
jgi:hypothetical protein